MGLQFNGVTKTISLTSGTTQLGVRDLWSRWVDWVLTSDNSKYPIAFSQVGGNDIDVSSGTSIPIYIFLLNGWRIKPQEANHTLTVSDGILLVDGGGDPFVNTTGSFIVRINYQQPVQAITTSSGGGNPWETEIETGYTAAELMRIFASVLGGKVDGAGSGTETFRDINDTKDRVIATVDEVGNRTGLTIDAT